MAIVATQLEKLHGRRHSIVLKYVLTFKPPVQPWVLSYKLNHYS